MTIEFVNISLSYNLTSNERDFYEHEYARWIKAMRPLTQKRLEYCADFIEKFSESVASHTIRTMVSYAHKVSARLVAGLRDTWFPQDYEGWLDAHNGEHFIPPQSKIPTGIILGSEACLSAAFLFVLLHRMRDAIGIKGREFVMNKLSGFHSGYIQQMSPYYLYTRRDGSRVDLFAHEVTMFSNEQTNNIHKKHSLGFYDKARRPTTVAYDVWSENPDGALVSTEDIGKWVVRRLIGEDYNPPAAWLQNTLMFEFNGVMSEFDREVQTGLSAYEKLYEQIVSLEKDSPVLKALELSESRRCL